MTYFGLGNQEIEKKIPKFGFWAKFGPFWPKKEGFWAQNLFFSIQNSDWAK